MKYLLSFEEYNEYDDGRRKKVGAPKPVMQPNGKWTILWDYEDEEQTVLNNLVVPEKQEMSEVELQKWRDRANNT